MRTFVFIRAVLALLVLIANPGCGSTIDSFNTKEGVKVTVAIPALSAGKGDIRSDPAGVAMYSLSWGEGADQRVRFQIRDMRLRVDGRDYGPVQKGDTVAIRYGTVTVNGVDRPPTSPAP